MTRLFTLCLAAGLLVAPSLSRADPITFVAALAPLIGGTAAAVLYTVGAFVVANAAYIAIAYSIYSGYKARQAARDAYNNSLTDRLTMTATVDASRSRIYGRVRNVDGVVFKATSGDKSQYYTLLIAVAGHEIDGIETVYFNDVPLTLDSNGYVLTAPWSGVTEATGGRVFYDQAYMTVTGGAGSVTLPYLPIDASISITMSDSFAVPSSVVSNVVTVSGAFGGLSGTAQVNYQYNQTGSAGTSKARVRKFLGAPDQDLSTELAAKFPGLITSGAHRFAGIALLWVDLEYDQDAFPQGIPNVTAVLRGAKVYDARSGLTAWTQNPALIARDWALYPYGGGADSSELVAQSFVTAANACDVTHTFSTRGLNGTVVNTSRPMYTCGLVCKTDIDPAETLNEITAAMAGRWAWTGGQLRIRAGAYTAPVMTLTEDWCGGQGDIELVATQPRTALINVITPTISDAAQNYIVAPAERVAPAAYIALDGQEYPQAITLAAVTDVDHAQHISGVMLRDSRQALSASIPCNFSAYPLEVFDTIAVTLPRFGFAAKAFEVLSWEFSQSGGVVLSLKETDASIYDPDAEFTRADPAPNTLLPSPFYVPTVALNEPLSGTAQLLKQADGSIVSRVLVSWAEVQDEGVRNGGSIEVRYGPAAADQATWQSVMVPGADSQTYLASVQDGGVYIIQARAKNKLVSGDWSAMKTHKVVGKTAAPASVSGFALSLVPGALKGTRTPSTEVDYDHTVYRYGASFAAGTQVPGTSDANGFVWPWPALGSYTVWAADVDTTGNLGTPVSQTITVDNTIKIGAGNSLASASAALNRDPTCSDPTAWSGPHQAFLTGIVGAPGGTCLTNAAGYASDELSDAAPIDPTHRYRLTISAARLDTSTAAIMFLGIAWYDAAGVLIVSYVANPPGWNNGSFSYFGLVADNPPPNFTTYSIEFGGSATAQAPINAASARIVALLNYSATPGAVHAITAAGIYDVVDVAAAQATANTAASNATSALGTLATMRSNGYLDASEKPAVIKQYQAIYDEQAGIAAQASAYGVTTERTAYISAFNALVSYLSGLSPAWNDTTSDTLITPAVDQATWAAYYSARQTLLNKIAEVAGTLAVWNSISGTGKPLDNAGKTVDLGGATGVFGARDRDDLPSEYPWGRSLQFKQASSIGLSGSDGTYCTLETLIQFVDDSGGPNVQYAYQGSKTWRRTALRTAGAWGSWTQDLDRNSYTGDLAATRNTVFYQDTDPGSVPDGSIWISSTKAYQRVSGAWQPYVGNGSVDTTQLASAAATDVTTVTFTAISFNNIA